MMTPASNTMVHVTAETEIKLANGWLSFKAGTTEVALHLWEDSLERLKQVLQISGAKGE